MPNDANIYFKHVTDTCEESASLGLAATSRFRAKCDIDSPSHLLEKYDAHGYRHEELVDDGVRRYFEARELNPNSDDRRIAFARVGASVFHFAFVTRWFELCNGIPFHRVGSDDEPGMISLTTISDLTASLAVTAAVVDDLYGEPATGLELACFERFYARFVGDENTSSSLRDEYLKVWRLSNKLSSHVLVGLTSGALPSLLDFDPFFASCDPVRPPPDSVSLRQMRGS